MKRVQASPPSLPSNKKAKVGNKGLVQADDGDDTTGEWTKVDKRKARKQKKSESKLDVCVLISIRESGAYASICCRIISPGLCISTEKSLNAKKLFE